MATATPECFHMSSADLIKKQPLDYGGFGEVYLCYHKTLGQVVLKTVYTGPPRNASSRRSLLEEGSLMTRLNHERVVKLLGVIMEDGDYSLVMELIPKGNLLVMLEKVLVPISIKCRIILEILEGMVYLTKNQVIHKDLKPENILVDKDFHIKIADLGLATCQTWSRLTKEESRRKSRSRCRVDGQGAGTLSYMAPEHLESIHNISTEKSDVYSFAIVVWVILTSQEPYANARGEDHICQCVRNGDRPSEDLIPEDTPPEICDLMKRCWHQTPQERPKFEDGYNFFLPVYREKLEPCVEEDLLKLRDLYEGPDDLLEKMKSLKTTSESLATDCPAPLLSSVASLPVPVPVETSIEDMHLVDFESHLQPASSIQTDARAIGPLDVEQKLDLEYGYHKEGRYYNHVDQLEMQGGHHQEAHSAAPQRLISQDPNIRQPVQDRSPSVSSVQSWAKAVPPASQEEGYDRPTSDLYTSMASSASMSASMFGQVPMSASSPSLGQYTPMQPCVNRQQSWPFIPVPDTAAPDPTAGHLLLPKEQGVFIQNARGIQIGHNNTLSIMAQESPQSLSPTSNRSASSLLIPNIHLYEDHTVTEGHLDLLRENIGSNWKQCARRLGLTEVEVETIDHDYSRDGLPEKVHQMLERWRMKQGSVGCTVGKLCKALEGRIKVNVIHSLIEISIQNSTP